MTDEEILERLTRILRDLLSDDSVVLDGIRSPTSASSSE
jgi:hypothetical protein